LENDPFSVIVRYMPRRARQAPGGVIYHMLNRAAGRRQLFDDDQDHQAFPRVFGQALARPASAASPGAERVTGTTNVRRERARGTLLLTVGNPSCSAMLAICLGEHVRCQRRGMSFIA
jgi:hypothetical protein